MSGLVDTCLDGSLGREIRQESISGNVRVHLQLPRHPSFRRISMGLLEATMEAKGLFVVNITGNDHRLQRRVVAAQLWEGAYSVSPSFCLE